MARKKRYRHDPVALATGRRLAGDDRIEGYFNKLADLDPKLSELVQRFGWVKDGIYNRTVLDQKTRELLAVAALTLQSQTKQLASHIRFALNVGARKEEVMEAIVQMLTYGGFPVTMNALDVMRGVFEDLDREEEQESPS